MPLFCEKTTHLFARKNRELKIEQTSDPKNRTIDPKAHRIKDQTEPGAVATAFN